MDDAPRARMPYLLLSLAMAGLALVLVAATHPDSAAAKGKKLHACVVKNGPDKGVMRFSRTGKCHKGEKKVSWSKKGKRGKAGSTGATGATGPQGPSGITQELLDTITAQQTEIDQLTTQLSTVTSQLGALTSQLNALSPQVAALCAQMGPVTSNVNQIRTVTAAVVALVPVGPALPTALSAFSCP